MSKAEVAGIRAELGALLDAAHKEKSEVIREACAINDRVRSVIGTGKLLVEYMEDAHVVIRALSRASANDTVKSLLNDQAAILSRQLEALQSRMAGLSAATEAFDNWKGGICS